MADARLQFALFGIDLMTNLWAQHSRKYFFLIVEIFHPSQSIATVCNPYYTYMIHKIIE